MIIKKVWIFADQIWGEQLHSCFSSPLVYVSVIYYLPFPIFLKVISYCTVRLSCSSRQSRTSQTIPEVLQKVLQVRLMLALTMRLAIRVRYLNLHRRLYINTLLKLLKKKVGVCKRCWMTLLLSWIPGWLWKLTVSSNVLIKALTSPTPSWIARTFFSCVKHKLAHFLILILIFFFFFLSENKT